MLLMLTLLLRSFVIACIHHWKLVLWDSHWFKLEAKNLGFWGYFRILDSCCSSGGRIGICVAPGSPGPLQSKMWPPVGRDLGLFTEKRVLEILCWHGKQMLRCGIFVAYFQFLSPFGDKQRFNFPFSVIVADIVTCIICLIVFRTKTFVVGVVECCVRGAAALCLPQVVFHYHTEGGPLQAADIRAPDKCRAYFCCLCTATPPQLSYSLPQVFCAAEWWLELSSLDTDNNSWGGAPLCLTTTLHNANLVLS